MTTTAMVLSILALVLSVASLGWQAWSWRHSGPVLRVEAEAVITDAGGLFGKAQFYVRVTVANRGRVAATIDNWGIETPGKKNLYQVQPIPFSDKLPARIEPHASASFFMPVDEIRRMVAEQVWDYKAMRPWVRPAGGKKVYAPGHVPLA